MTARPIHPHGEVQFAASAEVSGGKIVECPDGRAGVIQGVGVYDSGKQVSAATHGTYEVPAASATTFAVGVTVDCDADAQTAVAATTGDFTMGRVVEAKTAGQLVVKVALNEQA